MGNFLGKICVDFWKKSLTFPVLVGVITFYQDNT